MRLAALAFLGYSFMRSAALFAKPDKVLCMFPQVDFGADAEAKQIAMAYARALADLIGACGVLSLGGVKGRFAALAIIFPMFYVNHIVDGLAYPPLVPVVAANVVVLVLNIVEAATGGSLGKWSYIAMQGVFGLLFLTEPAFLVQDPFTFAVAGTSSLAVGQKLGFAVGMVLTMHAAMALLLPPAGPIVAMLVVMGGFVKLSVVDGIDLGLAPVVAASICLALCLFDAAKNGGGTCADKKDSKKVA